MQLYNYDPVEEVIRRPWFLFLHLGFLPTAFFALLWGYYYHQGWKGLALFALATTILEFIRSIVVWDFRYTPGTELFGYLGAFATGALVYAPFYFLGAWLA